MNEITYRILQQSDLENYKAIRYRCLQEYPDNFGTTLEEELASKFPKLEPAIKGIDKDSFAFGAFDGDNLIGICGFVREPRTKTKHRGEVIQMFVDTAYAGKGIGKALLKHTIDKAFENPAIEQITLSLVYGNEKAEKLYKQLGFVEYGKLANFFKAGDKYTTQLFMALSRAKP
jgi:RimJ/RimL family protein N-acetyltransferase